MTDHGDVNESFVVPWIALMIAHQSPGLDQPDKGSLYHPAPGRRTKPLAASLRLMKKGSSNAHSASLTSLG